MKKQLNKLQKGKRFLIGIGIGIILLSLALFAVSIYLLVSGSLGVSVEANASNIIKIVAGAILILLSIPGIVAGIYFTWLGSAMKALNGNIAEENLAMGTVNMKKCENCGSEINDEDKNCGNCGKSVAKTKPCPKCGAENGSRKRKCTQCGADLNQ